MADFIHIDTVPEDGRILWFDTVASIPSGWTRDTAFDDRMIYCDDSTYIGPSNFGGDHSHDLDDGSTYGHRHTMPNHTHNISAAAASGDSYLGTGTGSTTLGLDSGHTHGSSTSGAASYSTSYTTVTTSSTSSRPPCATAIVLAPDDALQVIPVDAVCPCDSASTLPAHFSYAAGMDGKYVVAADTGNDGGGTTGSANHTHTNVAHTHTCNHTHAGATCGSSLSTVNLYGAAGAPDVATPTHHTVTLTGGGASVTTDSETITLSTEDNDVRATKMYPVAADFACCPAHPNGVIIAWVGAAADLPEEWILCDGSGTTVDTRYNYIVWATANIGDENGAGILHTHSVTDHGHTVSSPAHDDHGTTIRWTGGKVKSLGGNNVQAYQDGHTHTWTVGSANVGDANDATNVETDEVSLESEGRTVILAKLDLHRATLGIYHGTGQRIYAA